MTVQFSMISDSYRLVPAALIHAAHFVGLLFVIRTLEGIGVLGMLTLCAVSGAMLPNDLAYLSDIAKEYPLGIPIDAELRWLYYGLASHFA